MQLGFVSAIVPDLSLAQVFETAQKLGYDCVELMCWPPGGASRRYAGVTHVDVLRLDDRSVAEIQELSNRHQVAISGLGYYPNPLSCDAGESEVAIEHIRAVIRGCRALNVGQMNTFIGRDWTQTVDENWPRFLQTWKPIIAEAEDQGVRVGIENCPMLFTADEWPGGKNLACSPAIWRRMFSDIASDHFGLNYDPSHMVLQRMDYVQPIREFADKLFHVHAKDLRIDRDRLDDVGAFAFPNDFHTPKLPGLGDVDWGRFFSTLTDVGYHGPVCVEVEDRAFESSHDDVLRSLQQSVTYLRQYVPVSPAR